MLCFDAEGNPVLLGAGVGADEGLAEHAAAVAAIESPVIARNRRRFGVEKSSPDIA
jgi:hypothetical protein